VAHVNGKLEVIAAEMFQRSSPNDGKIATGPIIDISIGKQRESAQL
jgi:hypothetical protein